MLSLTLLLEKCQEWNQCAWLCLVDFEKAIDTVDHDALWRVLYDFDVDVPYITLLKKLYANQSAVVCAGAESRSFSLARGVKQGDPISALLFIAVMEACFGNLKNRWRSLNKRRTEQYYGFVIDDPEEPLTNLRFADDVLLFAQSKADARKMLADLKKEASKYGLAVHLGKTKILTNCELTGGASVKVGEDDVAILPPDAAEKYLGRLVSVVISRQQSLRTE